MEFNFGGGGEGMYNPSTMDALSAMLGRVPGMMDDAQARRRATTQSQLATEAVGRESAVSEMEMKKKALAEARRREEEMKRAARDEQARADLAKRSKLNTVNLAERGRGMNFVPSGSDSVQGNLADMYKYGQF